MAKMQPKRRRKTESLYKSEFKKGVGYGMRFLGCYAVILGLAIVIVIISAIFNIDLSDEADWKEVDKAVKEFQAMPDPKMPSEEEIQRAVNEYQAELDTRNK